MNSTHRRERGFVSIAKDYLQRDQNSTKWIPLQLVLYFIDALIRVAVPPCIGLIVDRVTQEPKFVVDQLSYFLLGIFLLSCVFYINVISLHYLSKKIGRSIGIKYQRDLYKHLQGLSLDFFHRRKVGEVSTRLTHDIHNGAVPLYGYIADTFWCISILVCSILYMGFSNWRMLIVFVALLAPFILLTRTIIPRVRRMNLKVQNESGSISGAMTEAIAANPLVRAFAHEKHMSSKIDGQLNDYLKSALKADKYLYKYSDLINTFISVTAPLLIVILAGLMMSGSWAQGGLTIGELATVITYWQAVSGPTQYMLGHISMIFICLSSMDRVMEFFEEQPEIIDEKNAKDIWFEKPSIEFQNLNFAYPRELDKKILEGFQLTIQPGQKIAFVGRSGVGKSTLMKLLLRFYEPQQGKILIDGLDIRGITQKSLRENIGIVMQDTIILEGTIRENLLIANPSASDTELIKALEAAELMELIQENKEGLNTLLGERGNNLSGGQKQRLAIARIFLKNPPIIIMDEATSSLDSLTESRIKASWEQLMQERTSLIIAHRFNTIRDADEIVYLENGQIIGVGPHEELLVKCNEYNEMVQEQLLN